MEHWPGTGYAVYLAHSRDVLQPIYRWRQWECIPAALEQLFSILGAKPAIRSSQSAECVKGWLPFGGMSWSQANNMKWTERHLSVETTAVYFHDTEIWSPSWNVVFSEQRAPDVFVSVTGAQSGPSQQALVLALRRTLYESHSGLVKSVMRAALEFMPAAAFYCGYGPWALEWNLTSYSNGLSDRGPHLLSKELTVVNTEHVA